MEIPPYLQVRPHAILVAEHDEPGYHPPSVRRQLARGQAIKIKDLQVEGMDRKPKPGYEGIFQDISRSWRKRSRADPSTRGRKSYFDLERNPIVSMNNSQGCLGTDRLNPASGVGWNPLGLSLMLRLDYARQCRTNRFDHYGDTSLNFLKTLEPLRPSSVGGIVIGIARIGLGILCLGIPILLVIILISYRGDILPVSLHACLTLRLYALSSITLYLHSVTSRGVLLAIHPRNQGFFKRRIRVRKLKV